MSPALGRGLIPCPPKRRALFSHSVGIACICACAHVLSLAHTNTPVTEKSNTKAATLAQTVKNLPAVPETRVGSPGWEDPLENGMATYSSILAWRSPWTEEPCGLHSMGSQRVGHD